MFVALPFSFFMRRSLYYLAYTTRVPVCYLTGLPVHYCGGLLYHQICLPGVYRMRFGVLSPAMADSH